MLREILAREPWDVVTIQQPAMRVGGRDFQPFATTHPQLRQELNAAAAEVVIRDVVVPFWTILRIIPGGEWRSTRPRLRTPNHYPRAGQGSCRCGIRRLRRAAARAAQQGRFVITTRA